MSQAKWHTKMEDHKEKLTVLKFTIYGSSHTYCNHECTGTDSAFYEETLTTPSEVNMARRDSPNPIKNILKSCLLTNIYASKCVCVPYIHSHCALQEKIIKYLVTGLWKPSHPFHSSRRQLQRQFNTEAFWAFWNTSRPQLEASGLFSWRRSD